MKLRQGIDIEWNEGKRFLEPYEMFLFLSSLPDEMHVIPYQTRTYVRKDLHRKNPDLPFEMRIGCQHEGLTMFASRYSLMEIDI